MCCPRLWFTVVLTVMGSAGQNIYLHYQTKDRVNTSLVTTSQTNAIYFVYFFNNMDISVCVWKFKDHCVCKDVILSIIYFQWLSDYTVDDTFFSQFSKQERLMIASISCFCVHTYVQSWCTKRFLLYKCNCIFSLN